MFRLLLLLLVVAGVGAYFTKPDRAVMEAGARGAMQQARDAAASAFDIGGVLNLSAADFTRDGTYEDYYLVSKYTVNLAGHPVMQCWGAYRQVRCGPPITGQAATTTSP